jgi:hypothetical protein
MPKGAHAPIIDTAFLIISGAAGRDRTCDQRVTAFPLNSFSPISGSAALTTELSSAFLKRIRRLVCSAAVEADAK